MGIKEVFTQYWWIISGALIVLLIITMLVGQWQINRKIAMESEALMTYSENPQTNTPTVIQEKDLQELPRPVQKWLRQTGVIGQEKIRTVTLTQTGKMKLEPDQDNWIEPIAKQIIRVDEPGYLWHVDLKMMPVLKTTGRDLFHEGKGDMHIRIASLLPVANVSDNEKLNESSLHRFLLELPWYPTAALEDYMTWEAIDERKAKAIISYKGLTAEAEYFFSEEGSLLKQEALRYKDNDDLAERIPCIGEITRFTEVEGLHIPDRAEITWMIDDTPFTWYKLENKQIQYERY